MASAGVAAPPSHGGGEPARPGTAEHQRPARAAPQRPAYPCPRPIVHPGCAFAARRWPLDRYATVARRLARARLRLVVTGSTAERPHATRLAAEAGLPEDSVLAGRTTLGQLAALVADATLLISGDTGIAHLATAYGTPRWCCSARCPRDTGARHRSAPSMLRYGPVRPPDVCAGTAGSVTCDSSEQ